jgi:class 3 adenylate cyclase/tetratricopeptide (TPR) repeat protein
LITDSEQEEILDKRHAERKDVTILFSDLSEYTGISEKYDPEDVQTIMGEIFDKSRLIISSCGGSVERFLGDEIMAIFGHPAAHEDDAVRAINAARDIHRLVDDINARGIIEHPLHMHTGINTGMVITSGTSHNRLSIGITGAAANLAKRIQHLAKPGEILVGRETYRQAAGFFNFQRLDIQPLKGKSEVVRAYRYVGPQREPRKVRRIFGRRAELIAREKEIQAFDRAIADLEQGCGSVMCISGDVGTGKSRLAEEFKKRLPADHFIWHEGHAYEFTSNNSYFPVIDLYRRIFGIFEEDPPDTILKKISRGTARWADDADLVDMIGGLFALESTSDTSDELIDPEYWKSNLHRATVRLFNAMASHHPVVLCFEDLHWSDPSTIDLLSSLYDECTGPILLLLVFRPSFTDQYPAFMDAVAAHTTLLQIGDLAPDDCSKLVGSLLGTREVPDCLQAFVQNEVPGNPFFLEEVINSLIESETIRPDEHTWVLNRPLEQTEIAQTVRGIITSRVDRLDANAKEILRKASVIGNVIPFEILHAISRPDDQFSRCLDFLVELDLIRIKRRTPSLVYTFRHGLIREVVYEGILKSERRAIHARIGMCIENMFREHLPEHVETLSYHFKQGGAIDNAIIYLRLSGTKSLRRYAVEESHRYYQEAFDLIKKLETDDVSRHTRLVETLNAWFPVYYYRGRFRAAERIMSAHLKQVQSIQDRELRGMFYIGYGMCLWAQERFQEAYAYVQRALSTGRAIGSQRVEGYAHAWLTWVCFELGLPEETLAHGNAARTLAVHFDSGHYPYYRSLDSDGFAYWVTGESNRIMASSQAIFDYGENRSSSRVTTWGRFILGLGQMAKGDFKMAADTFREALKTSADPLYTMFPKLFQAIAAIADGDYTTVRKPLEEILEHGRLHGCEVISTPAELFLSVARCSDGNMRKNINTINRILLHWKKNDARWRMLSAELALGEFYLNLRLREARLSPLTIFRNLPFLLTALPSAAGRSLHHYRQAIALAETMGAKGMEGQAYLGMARLFHRQGNHAKAINAIEGALARFEQCDAQGFIRIARELKTNIQQT